VSDYVLRISNGLEGAKKNREATLLNERATRLAVKRDARVAYYEWIRAKGANFVGEQGEAQARAHLTDVEHALAAGLASVADKLRALSGMKGAELFHQRTASGVRLATERLRVIMGDPLTASYEVGENFLTPPRMSPVQVAAGVEEARSKRLELAVLATSIRAVMEQKGVVQAGNYPRLDLQGRAEYSNPNQRYFFPDGKFHASWDASAILSWTPTALLGTSAEIDELNAKIATFEAQRAELSDALRLEVTGAVSSYETAEASLGASHEQLAAAEENHRVRRELFRAGRGTNVEVTDAETELTRARLEIVNAYIDWHIAAVQLEHALGRDVK
jgi:outer membrane protein TolC